MGVCGSVSSEVETVRLRLAGWCLSTCQRINSKWQHLVKWQPLVHLSVSLSRSSAPSLPILADITFKSLWSRSAEMVSEWPWPCSVWAIDILFPPHGIVCPYYRRIFKPSSCGWLINVVQVCLIIWQHLQALSLCFSLQKSTMVILWYTLLNHSEALNLLLNLLSDSSVTRRLFISCVRRRDCTGVLTQPN